MSNYSVCLHVCVKQKAICKCLDLKINYKPVNSCDGKKKKR